MKEEFYVHNLFWEGLDRFLRDDPHLRRAALQPFRYTWPLVDALEFQQPGIFMLTGGRQVGKTTCLKQYIAKMLREKLVSPDRIAFLVGELIHDDTELRHEIVSALGDGNGRRIVIIDEISYVKDWDKAIKFLADAGSLEATTLIVSGSDSTILREAMKRFAGRRGRTARVDFVLLPLEFAETVLLKAPELAGLMDACKAAADDPLEPPGWKAAQPRLEALFEEYLVHGGYLTAIADWLRCGRIEPATFRTYAEWLRGDILKHNRQEKYLFEVLRGMMRTYASQVSWVSLAKDLSIEHHKTVADYMAILQDMHAVTVLEALAEHTLSASPKKAKKLYFADPFIFHTVETMLETVRADPSPELAETVAVSFFKRRFDDVFYIKGSKGEVDIAYVNQGTVFPVEVKWTRHIRPETLKQIRSYPNGVILGRQAASGALGPIPVMPLLRRLVSV